jgi:3-polyprenyl-4-hydroxybenzoate decarboxylase
MNACYSHIKSMEDVVDITVAFEVDGLYVERNIINNF